MLLLGENGRVVVDRVKDRVVEIQKTLPAGTRLVGFLDRGELIKSTLATAIKNLIEGGLLVIAVLFLFLLQVRAGLIVSASIPLAMLIAIIGMKYFNVSANLMSLGAIDFGLIVDGAVIIVENCMRRLVERRQELGHDLSEAERLEDDLRKHRRDGQTEHFRRNGIIIAAYIPILTLARHRRQNVPSDGHDGYHGAAWFDAAFDNAHARAVRLFSQRLSAKNTTWCLIKFRDGYEPALRWTLKNRGLTALRRDGVLRVVRRFIRATGQRIYSAIGRRLIGHSSRFIRNSMSIEKAVERATYFEKTLMAEFPDEIDQVFTRIGRPEVATDPMFPSQHDAIITFKPQKGWKRARSNEELVEKFTEVTEKMPGIGTSIHAAGAHANERIDRRRRHSQRTGHQTLRRRFASADR